MVFFLAEVVFGRYVWLEGVEAEKNLNSNSTFFSSSVFISFPFSYQSITHTAQEFFLRHEVGTIFSELLKKTDAPEGIFMEEEKEILQVEALLWDALLQVIVDETKQKFLFLIDY